MDGGLLEKMRTKARGNAMFVYQPPVFPADAFPAVLP